MQPWPSASAVGGSLEDLQSALVKIDLPRQFLARAVQRQEISEMPEIFGPASTAARLCRKSATESGRGSWEAQGSGRVRSLGSSPRQPCFG